MRKTKPLLERFWPKVDVRSPEECWNWTAGKDALGYGGFSTTGSRKNGGKSVKAYKFAYETVLGPVPEGLELDHLCRNPSCVNPAHLEPVTHAENMRRGMSRSGLNFRKTECKNGHPFTPENTMVKIDNRGRTHRNCRECVREANRRSYQVRKAAAQQ